MIKTIFNKLLMVIYFVIGALLLEALTFNILNLGVMPEYFAINFTIICFIAIFVYLIPSYTAQYVIFTIILLVQAIFIYVNYSLMTIYGDLFSLEMFTFIGEAGAAISSSFIYVSIILKLVAVYLILAIIGYLLLRICNKTKIKIKQHFSIFSIIIMITFQCFAYAYYFSTRDKILNQSSISQENYIDSDTFLMQSSLLKTKSYTKFGSYGYFLNMIVNQLSGENQVVKNATIDYFKNSEQYSSSDVFGVDNGNNVIVVMMESLEWFAFGDGTYSPLVDNLSMELMPNIYKIIYGDDVVTDNQNLNKDNDAYISTNFFSKAKTNMSEGIGILGSYPVGKDFSELAYRKYSEKTNAFGYSLPNVLKQKGYKTTYVHSNEITFYNRSLTHHNIGFDVVIGKDTIEKDGKLIYTGDDLKWDHWDNEGNFAQNAIDYIVPTDYQQKPFYTFYLNVSSHGPYTESENRYDKDALKYYNYIKYGKNCELDSNGYYKLKDSIQQQIDGGTAQNQDFYTNFYTNILNNYNASVCEEIVYYLSGVKGLDDAIGVMVDKLNNTYYDDGTPLMDKTTIVLYSDHNSYYNGLSNNIKGFPAEDYSSVELNTVPMIISSPGIKNYNKANSYQYLKNDKFCSAYNIVPTILDLLGIDFSKKIYMGSSLFDNSLPTYILNNQVYTMQIYYSITGGVFSKDLYTYNFNEYIATDTRVGQEILNLFNQEAYKTLIKINYLNILNTYQLYNQI